MVILVNIKQVCTVWKNCNGAGVWKIYKTFTLSSVLNPTVNAYVAATIVSISDKQKNKLGAVVIKVMCRPTLYCIHKYLYNHPNFTSCWWTESFSSCCLLFLLPVLRIKSHCLYFLQLCLISLALVSSTLVSPVLPFSLCCVFLFSLIFNFLLTSINQLTACFFSPYVFCTLHFGSVLVPQNVRFLTDCDQCSV